MTTTKRPLDDVTEPEQNSRTVLRKVDGNGDDGHPPSQQFVRISYPPSTPAKIPAFGYPYQLATFSYSPDSVQEFTNSAMRYYCEAPLGADLSYHYDKWIKKPESRGRLDGLLRACLRDEVQTETKRANVITWRGVMTKILTAPYDDQGTWDLNVMKVGDTLYLEEHTNDTKLAEKENLNPRRRLQTYYGYAFESYSTCGAPDPGDDPEKQTNGWGGDVDTNVQWCSIVKSKLDDLRMIIGGEVDCVNERYTGQPDTFIELKTSIAIRGARDEEFFEKKLLKFYFQSFLLGVPDIKVGFRTPAGKITTIQSFKTTQLPRLIQGKPHAWDPNLCLAWAKGFLDFIRASIAGHPSSTADVAEDESRPGKDLDMRVWRVTFHQSKGAQMILLDKDGVEDVRNGEDRVGFLPQWYWDEAGSASSPTAVNAPSHFDGQDEGVPAPV